MNGEGGNDILLGGSGNGDTLNGGGGNDKMNGGTGSGDVCNGEGDSDDTSTQCETTTGVP